MRLFLLAALVVAAPLAAQPADPVERLTEVLSLTPDQADLTAEVLDPDDPSSTWTLAAELVPMLSADQRAALFAQPERPEGAGRQGADRGDRGAGRQGGGRRAADPARAAVMRAARDAALGLDATQSAALDAALEGSDRRAMMQSLRDGQLPAEVDAVLTDAQGELYLAQVALQRYVQRGRGAGRRQGL